MKNPTLDLDPLVTFLSPRFDDPYQAAAWTPDLWHAVRHFMNDVTDDFYAALLDNLKNRVLNGSRLEQVEFILTINDPWSVAMATHWAAVMTVPSLKQLVSALQEEPGWFEYETVGYWLENHASYDQQVAVVRKLDPTQTQFPVEGARGELDIVTWLAVRQP